MSSKKFRRLLAAVVAAGIISTAALTAYTVYKHVNSSILTYIANEEADYD